MTFCVGFWCMLCCRDKVTDLPPDIINTMVYLEDLITFARIPRKVGECYRSVDNVI